MCEFELSWVCEYRVLFLLLVSGEETERERRRHREEQVVQRQRGLVVEDLGRPLGEEEEPCGKKKKNMDGIVFWSLFNVRAMPKRYFDRLDKKQPDSERGWLWV